MRTERKGKYIDICEFEYCYSIGIIDKRYCKNIEINGKERELVTPGVGHHFVVIKDDLSFFEFSIVFDKDKKHLFGKFVRELRKTEIEDMLLYLQKNKSLYVENKDFDYFFAILNGEYE